MTSSKTDGGPQHLIEEPSVYKKDLLPQEARFLLKVIGRDHAKR